MKYIVQVLWGDEHIGWAESDEPAPVECWIDPNHPDAATELARWKVRINVREWVYPEQAGRTRPEAPQ